MSWDISSTEQVKKMTISTPRDSLLTLQINSKEFLEKHTFEKNTNKIVKNWEKDEEAENFKHQLLSRYLLLYLYSHNL